MTCRAGTGLSSGSPAAGAVAVNSREHADGGTSSRVAGLGVDVTAGRDGDMPASGMHGLVAFGGLNGTADGDCAAG